MHVVRRAHNSSAIDAAPTPYASPLPPLDVAGVAERNQNSFVLLINGERQALHICSEPPSPRQHSCHGMLPPLGRRYLRGLPRGTVLSAFEPVWGERWEPASDSSDGGSAGSTTERLRRIARVLPLSQAGYAAQYIAHVKATASSDGLAIGDEGGAAHTGRRLMSHLVEAGLLCTLSDDDDGVPRLGCALRVAPREWTRVPTALLGPEAIARAAGRGSGQVVNAASVSDEAWHLYELVRTSVPFAGSAGSWAISNPFEYRLLVCELPDDPEGGGVPKMPSQRASDDPAALLVAATSDSTNGKLDQRARCLPPLAPGERREVKPLNDPRRLPRERRLAELRFVQLLPTRSQPAQNVGESASLDDDRLDVGVGVGSAVGLWTASHGFVPTGTRSEEDHAAMSSAPHGSGAQAASVTHLDRVRHCDRIVVGDCAYDTADELHG